MIAGFLAVSDFVSELLLNFEHYSQYSLLFFVAEFHCWSWFYCLLWWMMFQEVEIDDRNWNNWNRVDTPTSIEIVRCILEWRWQGFMWIFLNSHLSKACEAKNMCNKLLANKLLVIAYYECKHILLIKIHLLWDFITVNNFIKYVTYVM